MLLLDTSVLVWALIEHPRLGTGARERLTQFEPVHFSAIAIVELTIKSMLGKIVIPPALSAAAQDQGFIELPLTSEHAEAIRDVPELIRHDPFDRLLVAQAQCTGMTLLTADRVLLGLGRDFIVDAAV